MQHIPYKLIIVNKGIGLMLVQKPLARASAHFMRSTFYGGANMKKAKRLLAMLLAVVMIFSASCVSVYASTMANDYHTPGNNNGKYYFTYEQGCGWVLDVIDNLLDDLNIYLTFDELYGLAGLSDFVGDLLFMTTLNLDGYFENDGIENNTTIDLRSLDIAVPTLYSVLRCFHENGIAKLADLLGLLGDLLNEDYGLKRDGLDKTLRRGYSTVDDRQILEMLITWISNQGPLITHVVSGDFDWGSLLGGVIDDLLSGLLEGASSDDVPGFVRNLLYNLLINKNVNTMPADATFDGAIQQLLNWALITGTGDGSNTDTKKTHAIYGDGANSLLGPDMEPLLPALADQPGGAGVLGNDLGFDRDGDGKNETMSFYQLVSNVISAFMGGMVGDLVKDLLNDLLEVEITEELPYGDPALVNDQTFAMIVGIVVDLLTANGAPDLVYEKITIDTNGDGVTEEVSEADYPVTKIDALVSWLLVGNPGEDVNNPDDDIPAALDSFILIDFYGFHIQDNFMSLLNDLSRLLINLLPSLGLFASSAHLSYTPDDLNRIWYIDADFNEVLPEDESKVQELYETYEGKETIYATEYANINGASTPVAYCYLANKQGVNITDPSAADYRNPDLIRSKYVIDQDMVWANILKMALNDFIDGCYFPEWTEDIPSVLAYGFAALAAPTLPENNYFERLDAYHEAEMSGVAVTTTFSDHELLRYKITKTVNGKDVEVPYAALCIISSYLADMLNGILEIGTSRLTTDTTLEQFACEFLGWALYTYMPMFIGRNIDSASTEYSGGVWTDEIKVFITEVYGGSQSNFASIKCAETANFDAIYDLLDATLFGLLPPSWLPSVTGSNQLINEVLLNNLINFDLQGILDLLSVNMEKDANGDYVGELHKPVLTVLLNIIDRVTALIFNDNSVLLPLGRTDVIKNQNLTTIKSFDTLLDCNGTSASLPSLVSALISHIGTYKTPILATVLPLVTASSYQRPYDEAYLGTDLTSMSITDLEDYINDLTQNVNATLFVTIDSTYVPLDKDGNALEMSAADFVYEAVSGNAKAEKSTDGTKTNVILESGAVCATYDTLAEAQELISILKNAYVSEELIDEDNEIYAYHIYARRSHYESATATPATYDDGAGDYTKYTGFKKGELTYRSASNSKVSYDSDYRYFAVEDVSCLSGAGYAFSGAETAIDDAKEFVSSYESFILNDLSSAYGDWIRFIFETRLKNRGLFDKNGDGVVTDVDITHQETDADGNAVTIVDNYADGNVDVPTSMYPFYTTTDATAVSWFDDVTGLTFSSNLNKFVESEYEQLAMAIEYGKTRKYDVTLSDEDAEMLVRLALGTIEFDITRNGEGAYNGSIQWEDLTADQKTTIINWCNTNSFTFIEETLEDGSVAYSIKRPVFHVIDTNFNAAVGDLDLTPVVDKNVIKQYNHNTLIGTDTYEQEIRINMYQGYMDYIGALYSNRRSLYNLTDSISYRYEQFETLRSNKIDTTLLKWLTALSEDDYKNPQTKKLNVAYKLDEVTGQPIFDENNNKIEVKAFTATSYAKFRDAYDYAQSLMEAAEDANVSGAGITQSMATEAFYGLLEAWQNLVKFTGFADWVQLNSLMTVAYSIINDPYVNDATFGIKEGLENLIVAYNDAQTLKDDEANIDEERQEEIDSTAAALNSAITKIKYNSVPKLEKDPEATSSVDIQETEYKGNIQYAHIYNLVEGVGFGDLSDAQKAFEDLGLKVAGMTIDGTNYTVEGGTSEYGVGGTGAKINGLYQNNLRFEYTAILYGDLNGDARIDGTDANKLAVYFVRDEADASTMDYRYVAGDVNKDGAPDPADIQAIRDHYLLVEEISQAGHPLA